jgi:uncharacterized protein (TIRG00374 family)
MTRKNGIVFSIMLLVGMGIFYYSFRSVNVKQAWLIVRHANWWWLLVAVGAMVLYLFMETVIVKRLVDRQHDTISWRDAWRVPLVEQLGNGITPFATGGQPMQLIALAQAGIELGRASSILLMKFIVYQAMIVVNFVIAMVVGYCYIADKLHAWALLIVLGFAIHAFVIIGLLLVMYWPSFTRRLLTVLMLPVKWAQPARHEDRMRRLFARVDNFHTESTRISRDWAAMLHIIGFTFVQLFIYYLIPYFILLGLGATHVNIILVTALHVLIVMVISLFPIPGGAGGAEVGFSMVFSTFLSSSTLLVIAMMLWRIITYYLGMFSGIVAFNVKTSKQKESNDDKRK